MDLDELEYQPDQPTNTFSIPLSAQICIIPDKFVYSKIRISFKNIVLCY